MSTTANLGRAVLPMGVPQADLPGAESLIEWPLPPFHEAVGEIAPVFEGAVITCRDRRKVTGRLMRFSPATGTVESGRQFRKPFRRSRRTFLSFRHRVILLGGSRVAYSPLVPSGA